MIPPSLTDHDEVFIDQAPKRGRGRLVDAMVHVDTISEAPLRDQRVEGSHPFLADVDGHQRLGLARKGNERAAPYPGTSSLRPKDVGATSLLRPQRQEGDG